MLQSEAQLENTLIKQLNRLGFLSVTIANCDALVSNFRAQLKTLLMYLSGKTLYFENPSKQKE